jgi:hypothetical protein
MRRHHPLHAAVMAADHLIEAEDWARGVLHLVVHHDYDGLYGKEEARKFAAELRETIQSIMNGVSHWTMLLDPQDSNWTERFEQIQVDFREVQRMIHSLHEILVGPTGTNNSDRQESIITALGEVELSILRCKELLR